MIDESSKLDDPMEDPIDEFEHVLRKFDGGIGTLNGSAKEKKEENSNLIHNDSLFNYKMMIISIIGYLEGWTRFEWFRNFDFETEYGGGRVSE